MNNPDQANLMYSASPKESANSSLGARTISERASNLSLQDEWGPIGMWTGSPDNSKSGMTLIYDQGSLTNFDPVDDFALHESDSGNFLVLSGYSPAATLSQTGQCEIVNQLRQLEVEAEVVSRAIDIYYRTIARLQSTDTPPSSQEISKSPSSFPPGLSKAVGRSKSIKGSRKTQLIFYCVFTAYLELNSAVDPCFAADLVKLPFNRIDQALTEFSPTGANSVEPEKYIPFYVTSINEQIRAKGQTMSLNLATATEKVKEVIKTCRSTGAGREGIQNMSSKIVAIVALYFWLNDILGSEIARDTTLFERASYMSWACIRRYHVDIASYYNHNGGQEKRPSMEWLL